MTPAPHDEGMRLSTCSTLQDAPVRKEPRE
jgi:hypothetical protein